MASFGADVEEMHAAAVRLGSVVTTLQDEGHGSFDASSLGLPAAVSALERFVSNWSHGRTEIVQGVRALQQGLAGSATNYARVDTALAREWMPTSEPAP